jgi:hypothetical protein
MNALWDHYWPAITAALVVGAIAGTIAFRAPLRNRRVVSLAAGVVAVLALTAIWNGPAGAASRMATFLEGQSRAILRNYEMAQVRVQLERAPLKRTLVLSGPADDFQRGELVRILDASPGVASVRWANTETSATLPLLAEAELASLVGFGLGLVLAYLLELRRRSRAEWRW